MIKKLFIVGLLLLALILPVSAVILPPVADPKIIPEADTNFFFWNDSGTMGHTGRFATYPQLQDTKLYSATVTAAGGEVTVGEWITDPFTETMLMSPGLTRYRIYANVSSDVGVTTLNFIPYIHHVNGTDTRMFYGVPRTVDINTATPITPGTPNEYLVSYARRNYTVFAPGEALLIVVNASTTSVASRTVNFAVAGTNFASMATIGFWQEEDESGGGSTNGSVGFFGFSNGGGTPIVIWIFAALSSFALFIAAFMYRIRTATGEINRERVMFSVIGMVVSLVTAYLSLVIDVPTGNSMHSLYQIGALPWVFLTITLLCLVNVVYSLMMPELVKPEQAESKFERDENEDLYSDGEEE